LPGEKEGWAKVYCFNVWPLDIFLLKIYRLLNLSLVKTGSSGSGKKMWLIYNHGAPAASNR
jgi:hypothetical protein